MGANTLLFSGNTVNFKGLGTGYDTLISLRDSLDTYRFIMFDNRN